MGTRGLPDIYICISSALGPVALSLWVYTYIRQTTLAHITTIQCTRIIKKL